MVDLRKRTASFYCPVKYAFASYLATISQPNDSKWPDLFMGQTRLPLANSADYVHLGGSNWLPAKVHNICWGLKVQQTYCTLLSLHCIICTRTHTLCAITILYVGGSCPQASVVWTLSPAVRLPAALKTTVEQNRQASVFAERGVTVFKLAILHEIRACTILVQLYASDVFCLPKPCKNDY